MNSGKFPYRWKEDMWSQRRSSTEEKEQLVSFKTFADYSLDFVSRDCSQGHQRKVSLKLHV